MCKGPEVSALWVFKEPEGTMWLEWCMMGDGVRELTGARSQGSLVSNGQDLALI